MFKLTIKIQSNIISLILRKEGETVDEISWEEDRNMSRNILANIDDFLTKNNLNPQDIEDVDVESDMSERFTTDRIARTVAETFNFANKKMQ